MILQSSTMPTIRAALTGLMVLLLVIIGPATPAQAQDNRSELEWHDFEIALAIADSTRQPIFVDIWAPWCGWCRKMKRDVYPELKKQLNAQFVLSKINRDDNQTMHNYKGRRLTPTELARQLQTKSVPAIVMLNAKGEYILHLSDFIEAEQLEPILGYIGSSAYQSM